MPKSKIVTLTIDGQERPIEISHFYRRFLVGSSAKTVKDAVMELWNDGHEGDGKVAKTDLSGAITAMAAAGDCSYSDVAEAALAYAAGKKAVKARLAIEIIAGAQK